MPYDQFVRGIIAAAGVYALKHNVERLAEDHDSAKRFARLIAQIDGIGVDPDAIETNMIYFDVSGTGLAAPQVSERLLEQGERIGPMDEHRMRAVTHLDVDTEGVEEAAKALLAVVGRG